jgi:citrate lyase beta subunit
MTRPLDHVRSALFLPASNARALAKARTLACDLVILDIEDAVMEADKDAARAAVVAAAGEDWGGRLLAARINGPESDWHAADVAALTGLAGLDYVVLPKVEYAPLAERLGHALAKPLMAMIETPAGLYAAREIAGAAPVAGLIVGPNDLSASLRLPPDAGRAGLALAYQMVIPIIASAMDTVTEAAWRSPWRRPAASASSTAISTPISRPSRSARSRSSNPAWWSIRSPSAPTRRWPMRSA